MYSSNNIISDSAIAQPAISRCANPIPTMPLNTAQHRTLLDIYVQNYYEKFVQAQAVAAAIQQQFLLSQQRSRSPIALVIDTNVWVDYMHEINELEHTPCDSRIIIIVPATVVDELEKLKDRGHNHNLRERAGAALKYIMSKMCNRSWLMILNPTMERQLIHGGCIANYKMSPDDQILAAAQKLAAENGNLRVIIVTRDKSVAIKSAGLDLHFMEGRHLLELAHA